MKKAFWPDRDEECTTQAYFAHYGGKHDRRWLYTPRPQARCPACLEDVKLVGEDRAPHDRHFSHIGSSAQAPFCPLRNLADRKYEFLTDVPPDCERGRQLRASFFRNWKQHWGLLKSHLRGYADIHRFIEMIHIADKMKLWHRPSLSEWEVPYIFLVWSDYPPILDRSEKTKYKRREWYRFWFDARVRSFEDLWIRTEGEFRIVRAEYAIPRSGGSPGIVHLKDVDVFTMNSDFLARPMTEPHEYAVAMMIRAFPEELGH